jgi:hypothetical protein
VKYRQGRGYLKTNPDEKHDATRMLQFLTRRRGNSAAESMPS